MLPDALLKCFKAHPWHGVSAGKKAPEIVNAYIEIVPTDSVKYEVEKEYGLLRIDRPQKYSNRCPTLYGFVPRTYCGEKIGGFCGERTSKTGIIGDGDALDICVLSERPISHGDILLRAVPIGGLRMIDKDQADDKIVAVLHEDSVYGGWTDIAQCPAMLIDRLQHYFLTYKNYPGGDDQPVSIAGVYGREEAMRVIALSQEDYRAKFPDISEIQVA